MAHNGVVAAAVAMRGEGWRPVGRWECDPRVDALYADTVAGVVCQTWDEVSKRADRPECLAMQTRVGMSEVTQSPCEHFLETVLGEAKLRSTIPW